MSEKTVSTNLVDKHSSPLIIRKTTRLGFPLFIGLITDADLTDLDKVIQDGIDEAKEAGLITEGIQKLRNFVGFLSEYIRTYYDNKERGCIEGIAVVYYADKMAISSLFGDFMNHGQCRLEFYSLLNFMTQV